MAQNSNVSLIIKLLQETTTLSAVSNFLKEKGLHYSASSWEQLRSERLLPALDKHQLDIKDLINLLRTSEEYGRQHVFLYKCLSEDKISELLNKERIQRILVEIELSDILNEPKILEQPVSPTIVDFRFEENVNGSLKGVVIKIIESRITEKFVGERIDADDTINRTYKKIRERVVNVITLRANGDLEIRIASQESKSYKNNVDSIWGLIGDIFPRGYFSEVYLNVAKDYLWKNRCALNDVIKFSGITQRNDVGTIIKAATGSQSENLFDDVGANDCMETFSNHDAHCETHNIWFKIIQGESIPSNEIHTVISGELNEFAITPHSSEENYEYVISQLRKFNS